MFKPSYKSDSYRKNSIAIGNLYFTIGQFPLFWHCLSLQNSGAKYGGNKMLGQIQNFSVCLGNMSVKKLLKT